MPLLQVRPWWSHSTAAWPRSEGGHQAGLGGGVGVDRELLPQFESQNGAGAGQN